MPFAVAFRIPPVEVTIRREPDGKYLVYTVRAGEWRGTHYDTVSLAIEEARRILLSDVA